MTQLSEDAQYLLGKFSAEFSRFSSATSSDDAFDAKCEYRDHAIDLALQLQTEAKYAQTIDELLASRTVIDSHIIMNEAVVNIYSGLPISVMEPAFKQLRAAGYVAIPEGDGTCPGCRKECSFLIYELPGRKDGPGFHICFQCLMVYEQVSEWFFDDVQAETPKEAVTAHTEGMTLPPALYGLSEQMLKRVITGGYDADGEFCVAELSPVPLHVFREELNLMKRADYVLHETSDWDEHKCLTCLTSHGSTLNYHMRLPDGTLDRKSYRTFDICFSCFQITELVTIEYEAPKISQPAKEAVTAHTEGQRTIERIAPVQCASSGVDQTTSMPSLSSTTSTLYSVGK